MQLVLEIKNLNELQLLLQYLRQLPSAKVVEQLADKAPASPANGKTSIIEVKKLAFSDFHFPDKGQAYSRSEIYGDYGR